MHRTLVCLWLSLSALFGCTCTRGSGVEARQRFELAGFEEVESEGVFDVWIRVGEPFAVEAVADDNMLPMVEVEQQGRTLLVEAHGSISPVIRPRVEIAMPSLDNANLDGGGKISGLAGGRLRVTNASAFGRIELTGTLDELELDVEEDVDALGLTTRVAHVSLRRGADVELSVGEELVVQGSGQVVYAGDPRKVELGPRVTATRR